MNMPSAGIRHQDYVVHPHVRKWYALNLFTKMIRSAVSGSKAASALSAPLASEIACISSQWPRTMMVIRVATSHQTSILEKARVEASDVPKATMIARLMSFIVPGLRCRIRPPKSLFGQQPTILYAATCSHGSHNGYMVRTTRNCALPLIMRA
jgi:hypothetical protein